MATDASSSMGTTTLVSIVTQGKDELQTEQAGHATRGTTAPRIGHIGMSGGINNRAGRQAVAAVPEGRTRKAGIR